MEDSSGKSKGCGIVEFASPEDAQRAIKELNGTDLGGRPLKLREDRVNSDDRPKHSKEKSSSSRSSGGLGSVAGLSMPGLGQVACSVFVCNLDYKVNQGKLKDAFKAAGRVVRADVSEDSEKKSKGYGTVQFETPLEAMNAVFTMNGKSLLDRPMSVRLDRQSPFFCRFVDLWGRRGGSVSVAGTSNATAGMQAGSNLAAGMGDVNTLALPAGSNGLSGLSGLGTSGMNYGSAVTTGSVQNTQAALTSADTSSLTSAAANALNSANVLANASTMSNASALSNPSALTNAAAFSTTNAMNNASAMTNPYALWLQQLYSMQGYGLQNYAQQTTDTQPQVKADPTKQVFVRNLPWKVTWQELKDKFRDAGRVVRADVLMDDKQKSKGCGTVLFETAEDAARAVTTLNGYVMDGRQIEVRMDRG